METKKFTFRRSGVIIVGSGAAGLNAAIALKKQGIQDVTVLTEGLTFGTSRNTGSDKQTYYKLTSSGTTPDSVRQMAQTLFDGGCVDGDIALAEAAVSTRAFSIWSISECRFPVTGMGSMWATKRTTIRSNAAFRQVR